MAEKGLLAERFEASRRRLRAVAYRMLGSHGEAEDAVQEAWLRLARADTSDVADLRAWLTTVVARVSLDMLRTRKTRREEPIDSAETVPAGDDSAHQLELADSIGLAMLVVLETLSPPERVAFVLHDMFSLPFDDIAQVINRSPAAARQLASRARRRVQVAPPGSDPGSERRREVVQAFLAASRGGDFAALLAVLAPGVVLHADAASMASSVARAGSGDPVLAAETHGRDKVARTFAGSLRMAQLVQLDGDAALGFVFGGEPRAIIDFVIEDGLIVEIAMIADPAGVARLRVAV